MENSTEHSDNEVTSETEIVNDTKDESNNNDHNGSEYDSEE
jgi:hypothetical protein